MPATISVGALVYPVKFVERYTLLQPRCVIKHHISQHERYVDEVVSSDFAPVKGVTPGLYAKVGRAHDCHYIHELEVTHVRSFLGRYVEKLTHTPISKAGEIQESSYWIMPYSYLNLVAILPDWVKGSERLIVNHLRHYHSNYEQVLKSMRDSATYSWGRYLDTFVWFNSEIGRYYPDLMAECQRQINEKLGFNN